MNKLNSQLLIFLISITSIAAQERKVLELEYTLVQELELINENIFSAVAFSMNQNNVVAILDASGNQIISKDLNDGSTLSFPLVEGKGPGEVLSIWDIEINNQNIIVLADDEKFKFLEFKTDGTFLREYSPQNRFFQPFRISLCNESENLYGISGQIGKDGFLNKIDKEGKSLAVFEKVKDRSVGAVFHTDGNIFCDKEDNLYYTSLYTNIIRKYSPDGKIKFEREVFGFKPNDQITVIDGRFTSLNSKVRKASGELYVVGNFLVVGYSNRRDKALVALDYYDKDSGVYSHTIPFSKLIHNYVINEEYLVTVNYDKESNYFMGIYKSKELVMAEKN